MLDFNLEFDIPTYELFVIKTLQTENSQNDLDEL